MADKSARPIATLIFIVILAIMGLTTSPTISHASARPENEKKLIYSELIEARQQAGKQAEKEFPIPSSKRVGELKVGQIITLSSPNTPLIQTRGKPANLTEAVIKMENTVQLPPGTAIKVLRKEIYEKTDANTSYDYWIVVMDGVKGWIKKAVGIKGWIPSEAVEFQHPYNPSLETLKQKHGKLFYALLSESEKRLETKYNLQPTELKAIGDEGFKKHWPQTGLR
ncbi:MAG: hypothetical protein HZB29_09880 [Nitrospinae bacterium]|nr:hypothetical protein [Nitrospinota bacterium]